jgi:hypothetical protein
MSIDALPAEVRCLIVGMLSNRDALAVRLAHRCFAVRESASVLERRKHKLWLRTSPERACRVGRDDVLAFLYARKRVPPTLNLTSDAIDSDSADTVELVRRYCPHWNETVALHLAATRGRLKVLDHLIARVPSRQHQATDSALCLAAEAGTLVTVEFVAPRLTIGSVQRGLEIAARRDQVAIVEFLLGLGHDVCIQGVWRRAGASPRVFALLLERYPHLDVGIFLDKPLSASMAPSLDVVRAARAARPHCSLQPLLESTGYKNVARFAIDNDSQIDLARALARAAADLRFHIVQTIHNRDPSLDLAPLIRAAARDGHARGVEMLYAIHPESRLLKEALRAAPTGSDTAQKIVSLIAKASRGVNRRRPLKKSKTD